MSLQPRARLTERQAILIGAAKWFTNWLPPAPRSRLTCFIPLLLSMYAHVLVRDQGRYLLLSTCVGITTGILYL